MNANFPFGDLTLVQPVEPTIALLAEWLLRQKGSLREATLKLVYSPANISLSLLSELQHLKKAQYVDERSIAMLFYQLVPWQLILPLMARHESLFDSALEVGFWCMLPQLARFALVESKGTINVQVPCIQTLLTIQSPYDLLQNLGPDPYEAMRRLVVELDAAQDLGHPNSKYNNLSLCDITDIPLQHQHILPLIVCKLFNSLFVYTEKGQIPNVFASSTDPVDAQVLYTRAEVAIRSAPKDIRVLIQRFAKSQNCVFRSSLLEAHLIPDCPLCVPTISFSKMSGEDHALYRVYISASTDTERLYEIVRGLEVISRTGEEGEIANVREFLRKFNN